MNQEIQALLARKAKADSLPAEVRQQYAETYNDIVFELTKYALNYPLPVWDEDINAIILGSMFRCMGKEYDKYQNRPYIEWMCSGAIPEIDSSFEAKDQNRFFKCTQVVRQQLISLT